MRQIIGQIPLALAACVLAAGCGLFGSDSNGVGVCDGRNGLLVQTDREAYQVGEEATLTVENCTGASLFIDRPYTDHPDYILEKRVQGEWKQAALSVVLEVQLREIDVDSYEFALPVEPSNELVNPILGDYRFELKIYKSERDILPKEERVSNTFEITE